jgi:hypothetical protein
MMFVIGLLSMTLASSLPIINIPDRTTFSFEGAVPRLHLRVAPSTTCNGITTSFLSLECSTFSLDTEKKWTREVQ